MPCSVPVAQLTDADPGGKGWNHGFGPLPGWRKNPSSLSSTDASAASRWLSAGVIGRLQLLLDGSQRPPRGFERQEPYDQCECDHRPGSGWPLPCNHVVADLSERRHRTAAIGGQANARGLTGSEDRRHQDPHRITSCDLGPLSRPAPASSPVDLWPWHAWRVGVILGSPAAY